MDMGRLKVFATLLALTAICAFADTDLSAGGGTAIADEPENTDSGAVEAAGQANDGEQATEAGDEAADALDGDFGPSRPADGDED